MASSIPTRGLTAAPGKSITRFPDYRSNLLLDDFTGSTQAYALRQINKDYRGPLVCAMRASDFALQDIGFDSTGAFDTTTFNTFIGGSTGHAHGWYDQSVNRYHAFQKLLTTTAQFQIIPASALNGRPCLRGTGTQYIDTPKLVQFPSKRGTLGAVYDITGSVAFKNIASTDSEAITPVWNWYAATITNTFKWYDGTAVRSIAGFAGANLNIETLSRTADTNLRYRNNGASHEDIVIANTQPADNFIRLAGQTSRLIGDIYEFYVWPTTFDTTTLHTAINTHFAGY